MKKQKRKQPIPKKKKAATAVARPSVKKLPSINLSKDKKNVLHVVFGNKEQHAKLHDRFKGDEWHQVILEVGLDSNHIPAPDMSIFNILKDESFDALWTSHTLEFFHPYQIGDLIQNFYRVLKYNGIILVSTPDMQQVAEFIYRDGMDSVMYKAGGHSISPLDMLYGFRPGVAKNPQDNVHRIGFGANMLGKQLQRVNFAEVKVQRDGYKLWGAGIKLKGVDPKKNPAKVVAPEVNKKMAIRDNIDQKPILWNGFPPKS